MRLLILLLFLLSAALPFSPLAANAEKRVALVLGNASYEQASPLKNPVNDASDMAVALGRLGFEVVTGLNLTQVQLQKAVRDFSGRVRGADVAVLFYAGHAIQVDGTNYLAPVDTNLQHEGDVEFATLPLSSIQSQMEREAKTVLVFLDACRNNPFLNRIESKTRTFATRGLARMQSSGKGTLIAFATSPEEVAFDGEGRNSPFSRALLAHLERPGIEVSTMLTDVRLQVFQETDGKQVPWTNSSLLGRFYFNPDLDTGDASADAMKAESAAWTRIMQSRDEAAFETFLTQYPDGTFADLARLRLKSLQDLHVKEARLSEPDNLGSESPTPSESEKLTLSRNIQRELRRIGCYTGAADGMWGRDSRKAAETYLSLSSQAATVAEPSPQLLAALKTAADGECRAASKIEKKPAPQVQKAKKKAAVKSQQSGSGSCIVFNDERICD